MRVDRLGGFRILYVLPQHLKGLNLGFSQATLENLYQVHQAEIEASNYVASLPSQARTPNNSNLFLLMPLNNEATAPTPFLGTRGVSHSSALASIFAQSR